MRPALVLLPSAVLGPAVWRPTAQILASHGWEVAEVPHVMAEPQTTGAQLTRYLDALPADHPLVVVPHSNAGLFVPALTAERRVAAMVYVDAGIPPASGPYAVAPGEFYEFLERLADQDGRLPVWTQWWDPGVSELFPTAAVRAQVEAEQRRLSLSYFAGSLTATVGWDDRPAAYLAFGDTYDAERTEAVKREWAVSTLAGRHLHMVVDPEGVAHAIEHLLTQILPIEMPPRSR